MKFSMGADERLHVVDVAMNYLLEQGHEVVFYGPEGEGSVSWPTVAQQVAEDVAAGRAEEGVLFCWTGTGVSIAANKIIGIRAALCHDAETARGARLWNNANVLCLSMRATSDVMVKEILEAWISNPYQPNAEDDACLRQVAELEAKY